MEEKYKVNENENKINYYNSSLTKAWEVIVVILLKNKSTTINFYKFAIDFCQFDSTYTDLWETSLDYEKIPPDIIINITKTNNKINILGNKRHSYYYKLIIARNICDELYLIRSIKLDDMKRNYNVHNDTNYKDQLQYNTDNYVKYNDTDTSYK